MTPHDCAAIRRLEERYTGCDPQRGYTLMQRAGLAAAQIINNSSDGFDRIVLLAGKGNNGGDALVAARYLKKECIIYSVCAKSEFKGEAACAVRDLPENIPFFERETLDKHDFRRGDLIVDGLLGIGFSGTAVRGRAAGFIDAANASGQPVISLDVPSGVDASTGVPAEPAVRAAATIMFGAVKSGAVNSDHAPYWGVLRYCDIGLDSAEVEEPQFYTESEAYSDVKAPDFFSHKNSRSKVLIYAGCRNYSGAAQLNLNAALRSGSGIVRLVTGGDLPSTLSAGIVRHVTGSDDGAYPADAVRLTRDLFDKSNVLLAGSGWGAADAGLLADIFEFSGPVILDADAINALCRTPDVWCRRKDVILTPHWGEAMRLAESFKVNTGGDRIRFALRLAQQLNCIVVLKGPRTVTASPDGEVWVNSSGCSRLAIAGSGDALAGVIASVTGDTNIKGSLCRRAACGVWIHGVAGELLSAGGVADDLAVSAGKIIRILQNGQVIPLF